MADLAKWKIVGACTQCGSPIYNFLGKPTEIEIIITASRGGENPPYPFRTCGGTCPLIYGGKR